MDAFINEHIDGVLARPFMTNLYLRALYVRAQPKLEDRLII